MNIFIDTTSNYIILLLFNDDIVVDYFYTTTNRNQSEIFVSTIDSFLKENSIDIHEISNFFFAAGPGSFTGIRVGLTFMKGLLVSGFNNIYTISSLHILLDNLENSVSVIDARGGKYYYQKAEDGKITQPVIVEENIVSQLLDYNTYENSLENIADNVINLVKNGIYSSDYNGIYLKDAF